MLTLIVKTDDGARRKAVVKAGQEITIIRANPFLEKQGDYSLDIDLPLAGCAENIKIFGPAHRTEIAKLPYVGKRYPARLYAPPVSLKGSITVTKVTDAILTVQFIGGYSEMTESFKDLDGAEMYIDQLDGMGKAWDDKEIFADFYNGKWAELMKEENPLMAEEDKVGVVGLYNYVRYNIDKLGRAWENMWHLNLFAAQPDSTNYVAFPIMDADGQTVRNKWYPGNMQYEDIDGEPVPRYKYPSLLYLDLDDQAYDQGLAPQPYLFFALGRILKAIGYNLVYNELEGTWLNSIFIANAFPSLDLKDMLPHVRISDFIEEIEKYLHVYVYVDGRDVYIYHNKLEDVGARERIREVVAEYEDSFEDPDTDAVLSANLWYNYKNKLPKTLTLEEDDYKNLIIRANGRDYNGILTGSNLHRMLEIKEDGRAYAYLYASEHHDANPYLAEVDQMGILFRDYTRMEADIKYKIQPARGSSYQIEKTVTYEVETPDAGELDPNAPGGTITWDNDWAIVGEKDVVDGMQSGNGHFGNIGTPSGGFNPGTGGGTIGGGTIGGGTIGGGTGGIGNITLTSADVEPLSGGYNNKTVHFTEYIPALYNDLEGATPTIGYQQAVLGEDAKERKDDGQIYIAANLGKNYKVSIYNKAYVPFAFALNQYTNAKDSDYILTQDGDYGKFSTPLTQEFHARNIEGIAHCPFALRETRKPCLQTDAWQQVSNVDTRVVHTVQFKDQAISFDPTATYIIHGRRFACKKIELKITDRGLSPLKTGYFYEIKD